MKRESDKIRYFILQKIVKGRCNIEAIRAYIKTGLPTVLKNAENLQRMGFIKIHKTEVGKRAYRELEITKDGIKFLVRLKKIFED